MVDSVVVILGERILIALEVEGQREDDMREGSDLENKEKGRQATKIT